MSRLGAERPDSTKLRWRCETSASTDNSSWLMRRRWRQVRSRFPAVGAVFGMVPTYATRRRDPITSRVIDRQRRRRHLPGHGAASRAPPNELRRKTMSLTRFHATLQNILLLDAATCVGAGALMAFGSHYVAGLTAIPAPLLTWAGVIL